MGNKKKVDPNSVKLDGHDFNKAYLKSFKNLKDFMDEANDKDGKTSHKEAWFPKDPERDAKLKQVWELANDIQPKAVSEEVKEKP